MKQLLSEEQQKTIHALRVKSGEAMRAGKMDESISLSLQAWEQLPEPKFNCAESYHVVNGLIFIYMQANDYTNAKKWSEILYDCAKDRFDDGDREYVSGKVAFAMDDIESAKKFFTIANKKSGGRCFEVEDKKYKNLIDKEEIIPTKFKDLYKLSIKEFEKGDFGYALSLAYDCLNHKPADADVHLHKGKCHFELKEMDHAADSFTRAYMLKGEKIFKKEDKKYIDFLRTKIEIK